NFGLRLAKLVRMHVVPLAQIPLLEKIVLLQVREYDDRPGDAPIHVEPSRRDRPVSVMVIVDRHANLLEVVSTSATGGGLADFLDRRQQERDEDADNGNHHQQFDEGKPATLPGNHDPSPRTHQEIKIVLAWAALKKTPTGINPNPCGAGKQLQNAGEK